MQLSTRLKLLLISKYFGLRHGIQRFAEKVGVEFPAAYTSISDVKQKIWLRKRTGS